MPEPQIHQIALFKGKAIRKTLFNKEWYFSIIDVIEVLTDSPTPRQYIVLKNFGHGPAGPAATSIKMPPKKVF